MTYYPNKKVYSSQIKKCRRKYIYKPGTNHYPYYFCKN